MLSKKARFQIFGLALEAVFEQGDYLEILKNVAEEVITDCDEEDELKKIKKIAISQQLAVITFMKIWGKVKRTLIEVGSWVDRWEAKELCVLYLKDKGINNNDLWEGLLDIDTDLHLWAANAKYNNLLEERRGADPESKAEIDRISLIRAIISAYMIDTRILQGSDMHQRLDFTFAKEIQMVIDKIMLYRLPVGLAEMVEFIEHEFPFLPPTCYHFLAENYLNLLERYRPLKQKVVIHEKKDDYYDDFDALFDAIIMEDIPNLETREPVYLINGSSRVKTELESKNIEVSAENLCSILKALIPHYDLPEIQGRAMEELRTFNKHCRDHDKLGSYWKMLMITEGNLASEFDKNDYSEEMKKLGQIISAVSMFKIDLGNNTALLQHLPA